MPPRGAKDSIAPCKALKQNRSANQTVEDGFDTLVAWTPLEFSELECRLAEIWTISDDGKSFNFVLGDDVTFHDGTPFEVASVRILFERSMELNAYAKAKHGPIESIDVNSPTELTISLSRPYPAFMSILVQLQSANVGPSAVAEKGKISPITRLAPDRLGSHRDRKHDPDPRNRLIWHGQAQQASRIPLPLPSCRRGGRKRSESRNLTGQSIAACCHAGS